MHPEKKTGRNKEKKKRPSPFLSALTRELRRSHSYLWADAWGSPVRSSCCSALKNHLSLICCCDDSGPAPLWKEHEVRRPAHKWASRVCCTKHHEHQLRTANRLRDQPQAYAGRVTKGSEQLPRSRLRPWSRSLPRSFFRSFSSLEEAKTPCSRRSLSRCRLRSQNSSLTPPV